MYTVAHKQRNHVVHMCVQNNTKLIGHFSKVVNEVSVYCMITGTSCERS